jgi:hypothetical protein
MPVQAVRFRATDDSVDFFFATRAPVAKLDSVAPANVAGFAKYWITGWNTPDVVRDSVAMADGGSMQWTRRLPLGYYNYRVEAIMPGTRAAGRAASDVMLRADSTTGFALVGFGMSDLLFAHSATATPSARRWRDVQFTPLTGDIVKGATVSIVWETYEVGRRNDAAEYHVAMTLNREESFGGRMSMDIVSGVETPLKRQSKVNQIVIDYDRVVPFAPTLVDNLTLSFGSTPAGAYYLTIAVTDRASGRTTSRTTRIVIRE